MNSKILIAIVLLATVLQSCVAKPPPHSKGKGHGEDNGTPPENSGNGENVDIENAEEDEILAEIMGETKTNSRGSSGPRELPKTTNPTGAESFNDIVNQIKGVFDPKNSKEMFNQAMQLVREQFGGTQADFAKFNMNTFMSEFQNRLNANGLPNLPVMPDDVSSLPQLPQFPSTDELSTELQKQFTNFLAQSIKQLQSSSPPQLDNSGLDVNELTKQLRGARSKLLRNSRLQANPNNAQSLQGLDIGSLFGPMNSGSNPLASLAGMIDPNNANFDLSSLNNGDAANQITSVLSNGLQSLLNGNQGVINPAINPSSRGNGLPGQESKVGEAIETAKEKMTDAFAEFLGSFVDESPDLNAGSAGNAGFEEIGNFLGFFGAGSAATGNNGGEEPVGRPTNRRE